VRRGLIGVVCGRRGKWLIVGLWLVLHVVAAPLASKLTGAQDNDAASWLPGSAESTQVLDTSDKFRPEQIPAVVVYAREGGLTAQDKRRIAQDAQQIKGLTAHGVRGAETRGPVYDNASAPEAAQIYSSRRSCWSCC
jgi:RND superfamily putative drug exporter